jgi:hypothetical protein
VAVLPADLGQHGQRAPARARTRPRLGGLSKAFIDAGASLEDATVAGKPPSSEVAELLAAYAVGPPADPGAPGRQGRGPRMPT